MPFSVHAAPAALAHLARQMPARVFGYVEAFEHRIRERTIELILHVRSHCDTPVRPPRDLRIAKVFPTSNLLPAFGDTDEAADFLGRMAGVPIVELVLLRATGVTEHGETVEVCTHYVRSVRHLVIEGEWDATPVGTPDAATRRDVQYRSLYEEIRLASLSGEPDAPHIVEAK